MVPIVLRSMLNCPAEPAPLAGVTLTSHELKYTGPPTEPTAESIVAPAWLPPGASMEKLPTATFCTSELNVTRNTTGEAVVVSVAGL